MLKLNTTTRKLQAVLSGAVTTNQLPCMVSYSDDNGTTYVGGTQLTNTNNTTQVDICAAPAASTVRDIDYLSIRNRDTATATVTVMIDDSATDYEIVKATLAVGDQLVYVHGSGWSTLDSAGQVKSSATGGGVSDGDKGDITVSSSGAVWTIDSATVTLAKMANLAQDQFIGRTTASTGVPETATITAAARTVLDDTSTGAMATTLGLGTGDSPQFTGINLGHASDTTLTRASAGVVAIEGVNICTDGAWTDYSASSTIVGWSSFTTKLIYYKDIGKTRFIYIHFDGTSNSTSTSFTVPTACTNTMNFGGQIRTDDNGTTNLGHYVLTANTSTVNCYYGVSAAAWTASGTKRLLGQFTYQLP